MKTSLAISEYVRPPLQRRGKGLRTTQKETTMEKVQKIKNTVKRRRRQEKAKGNPKAKERKVQKEAALTVEVITSR